MLAGQEWRPVMSAPVTVVFDAYGRLLGAGDAIATPARLLRDVPAQPGMCP